MGNSLCKNSGNLNFFSIKFNRINFGQNLISFAKKSIKQINAEINLVFILKLKEKIII